LPDFRHVHSLARACASGFDDRLCAPFDGLGPFAVTLLLNVLSHFDARTRTEVVDRVLATLRPRGLLLSGIAEGRVPCGTPLQVLGPGVLCEVAA